MTVPHPAGFRQALEPLEFQVFRLYGSFNLSGFGINLLISGGKDSMALAHVHHRLSVSKLVAQVFEMRLHAVHFNHKKRGEDSDGDEVFVSDWCLAHNIPLQIYRWPGGGLDPANKKKLSMQQNTNFHLQARHWRQTVSEQVRSTLATQTGLCYFNCTAHHLCDNSESVLAHLTRGSGVFGMMPMPLVNKETHTVHPLAETPLEKVTEYAAAQKVIHREDATNAQRIYTRNRLRHDVLPVLRALNPQVDVALLETGRALEELVAEVQAAHKIVIKEGKIWGTTLPSPALFHLLARRCHPGLAGVLGKNATRHILHTIALWRANGRCSLGPQSLSLAQGWRLWFDTESMWFEPPAEGGLQLLL